MIEKGGQGFGNSKGGKSAHKSSGKFLFLNVFCQLLFKFFIYDVFLPIFMTANVANFDITSCSQRAHYCLDFTLFFFKSL